jgi:hypothetical protein
MAKRRTSQVQRQRASRQQLNQRVVSGSGRVAIDWRLVAIAVMGVLAVIVVGVALVLGVSGGDRYVGQVYPDNGRSHIPVGENPTYNSVPATSGPHWAQDGVAPAAWGVYSSPLAEPAAVHNLEHGGIVIWYQPAKLTATDRAALEAYVREQTASAQFKLIVSPYGGKNFGHPIAVVAWRWLLYLDSADLGAIRGFAQAHYGKAPEPLGGPGPPAG